MKVNRIGIAFLSSFTVLFTLSCMFFTEPRGPLQFDPPVLPDAQAGIPYDAKITITGNTTPAGQFSLSEGALPAGLALEKVAGEDAVRVFGVPEQPGTYKFKVYVWCYGTNVSGQVGEKEYSLVVK